MSEHHSDLKCLLSNHYSLCSCSRGFHVHHACGLWEKSGRASRCVKFYGSFQNVLSSYLQRNAFLCLQAQIDQYVGLIRTQVNSVVGKWVFAIIFYIMGFRLIIVNPSLWETPSSATWGHARWSKEEPLQVHCDRTFKMTIFHNYYLV